MSNITCIDPLQDLYERYGITRKDLTSPNGEKICQDKGLIFGNGTVNVIEFKIDLSHPAFFTIFCDVQSKDKAKDLESLTLLAPKETDVHTFLNRQPGTSRGALYINYATSNPRPTEKSFGPADDGKTFRVTLTGHVTNGFNFFFDKHFVYKHNR